MQSEDTVDIAQRYLLVGGRASSQAQKRIQEGLPNIMPANSRVCFISFAYADLPLPKAFDTVFRRDAPEDKIFTDCRIVAVTQQIDKPFHEVPHGWKTICLVEFPDGVPVLTDQLPEVSEWYEGREPICLCNRATWERLRDQSAA